MTIVKLNTKLAGLGLLFFVSSAAANDIGRCLKMAGHPDDPGVPGFGIEYKKIQTAKAVEQCQKALQLAPGSGVVNITLSRAYNKLEDYTSAIKHVKIAIGLDYPFANFMMGIYYSYGEGVAKDPVEANRWYRRAGEKGAAAGSRAYADSLRQGEGVDKDLSRALVWIDKAIAQGSIKAHYNRGLILEDQANTLKGQSNRRSEYLRLLTQAHKEVALADFKTRLSGDKALVRIRKKIEAVQPRWAEAIPAIATGRKAPAQGNPWRQLPGNINRDGISYRAVYTSVGDTVLALWHAWNARQGSGQWFIDFDYRGKSQIEAMNGISVHYDGDLYGNNVHATYEKLQLREMAVLPFAGGYRAIAKIDYRSVELLRNGSDIIVRYWKKGTKSGDFTFALNIKKYRSKSADAIASLEKTVAKEDKKCCQRSSIVPFSLRYWQQKEICEHLSLYPEADADRVYWKIGYPDPYGRTTKEKKREKAEQLQRCIEVRMPVKFKERPVLRLRN